MTPTYIGDIDLNEDTIAHYGVKGMKWHKRKKVKKTNAKPIKKNTDGTIYTIDGKKVSKEEWDNHHKNMEYQLKNSKQSKAYINASKNARTNEEKKALNTAFMNSNDGMYDYSRVNNNFITKKRKKSK